MKLYACPCGATTTQCWEKGDPAPMDEGTPTPAPPMDADGGLPLCHTCAERVKPL